MIEIASFEPGDYDEAIALWRATEGLVLRDVDSRAAVLAYLARNPGLSFVARDGPKLVGAVLTGTDGRRGYLQHLAVAHPHRGKGLGRSLAERVIQALGACGVEKCHLMVRCDNEAAKAFWQHLGWTLREDIALMSYVDPATANA